MSSKFERSGVVYHAIVKKKVRALFDAVSRGDAGPVISSFSTRFEHTFLGEGHAMAGTRTSRDKVAAWYGRLYRLLPDIRFDVSDIAVSGPPWNTIAVVTWRETNSGSDGVPTSASGYNVAFISWGRMTRLLICPDVNVLKATLDRLFEKGNNEAHAEPIVG